MSKIEIIGLDKLKSVFNAIPIDMRPSVIREIAKKPANKAVSIARQLQPIGKSGVTAKTIGLLRIKNQQQPFVEVNYKGRSLGHIYTSGATISRRGRGVIKGFPWIFNKAGTQINSSARSDMKVDLTKLFIRSFKKRGIGYG